MKATKFGIALLFENHKKGYYVDKAGNSPSFIAISNSATATRTLQSAVVCQSFLYGTTRTLISSPC